MEILLAKGELQKDIALVLKVNPSTISRERKRKRKNGYYDAETADHKAQVKRSNASYKGKKVEKNTEAKKYIVEGLKAKRSPDEISGRMEQEKQPFYVGKDAIYAWLRSPYGQVYCKYLCTKRYRKKKQKKAPKREMIPNRQPLSARPTEGVHAEGDLFVSPTSAGTPVSGAFVVVPDSKLFAGTIIQNRKPATMTIAIQKILSPLTIDDMTLDNGIENKKHEEWGISTYFADPYSPWQKPHVECGIGLVRRWFIPKGTDLRELPEEKFQEQLHILNGKYRKSLGYKSAYEVSLERGIIKEIPKIVLKYY
jgi:IS30 family transposase